MARKKKSTPKKPKIPKVQHYVHFERVEARKADGWKVVTKSSKDSIAKQIARNSGDLVLMEK